jgi:tetratricopeptide (TPR) repeat protein
MKKLGILTLLLTCGFNAEASFSGAWRIYQSGDKNHYPQLVSELIQEKMYFSSIPFLKEYLATTNRVNDNAVDKVVDQLVGEVGVKQFEILPTNILEKSRAPIIRYILARKAFRQGKYEQALKYLDKTIEDWNPVKPFALLLEGSIYAVSKREDQSARVFKECVDVSIDHIKKEKDKDRLRQLKIGRDYCIVGISRAQFSQQKYDAAYSSYLDLEKSSYIWPEILFEEAWNSFYLKDYNRTLGKLVTYKAPVFSYVFNPEVEVLKALSFMELCLWEDSKKVVENFYTSYEKDFESYKKYIDSMGKDYKLYYSLVKDNSEGKIRNNAILNTTLSSVARDPAYLELFSSFNAGREEIEKIKSVGNEKLRNVLNENLKESLTTQRNLIGSYIRGQLQLNAAQIVQSFEDMSYIKLEVLSKRKNELYDNVSMNSEGDSRNRGNIAHLRRSDKQYFWTFNGEFWADELGDYVFSLKSECR